MSIDYRKKPVVIQAIQWDGTATGIAAIERQFPGINTVARNGYQEGHPRENEVTRWEIGTLEGRHIVSPGDYVIRGVKGEFYPCKPDIFVATYDPA